MNTPFQVKVLLTHLILTQQLNLHMKFNFNFLNQEQHIHSNKEHHTHNNKEHHTHNKEVAHKEATQPWSFKIEEVVMMVLQQVLESKSNRIGEDKG